MKPYKIIAKIPETADVLSLRLVDGEKGGQPDFIAGQYVTVLFPELGVPSGKAYSLSSSPSDDYLQITVKKIGEYSSRLHQLEIGDELLVSEPYGFLNPEFDAPIMAIAGGVGIAPIISIIRDALERKTSHQIELIYSNRTIDDIVFRKDLENLMSEHKQLRIKHFITRQQKLPVGFRAGRIDVKKILARRMPSPETFYFICGREDFVGDMWRGLIASSVPENKIATETFF
jgi:ferredoxin-NADP reductase